MKPSISIILISTILLISPCLLLAQENCNTFLGSIGDANNNCAPCTNGMEVLLQSFLIQQDAIVRIQAMNRVLNQQLDSEQSTIDFLMASQDHTDSALESWKKLNENKQLTTENLQYVVEGMRAHSRRFPGQAAWLGTWIQNFESLMSLLKEEEDLKKQAEELAKKIAEGQFGHLENLVFDCCPDAKSSGEYRDDQLKDLNDLLKALEDYADNYISYRSRLVDEAESLTEQLKTMLRKRAGKEAEATETRDQYANGLSGFVMSKVKEVFTSGIEHTILQVMGFEMDPRVKEAMDAFNRNVEPLLSAAEKAGANFGAGGGGGGWAGEVAQMVVEQAWDGLSPEDQAALGMVTNAVFTEIASTVLRKTFEQSIKSGVARYFLLGLEGSAATAVSLFDKMVTIPAYLWEDKNLMILQGSFDWILLGLFRGIHLAKNTGRFLPSDPFEAYIDALKAPNNRAIEICLPEQSFSDPLQQNMVNAFFDAAFPGRNIKALSANDRDTIKVNGKDTYLEYHYSNKLRFKVRFGCYCGVMPEPIAETTPDKNNLPVIDLTGWQAKPGFWLQITEGSRLWMPLSGGIVGGGIITYFLTRDNHSEEEPPELITRDDDIIVPCDGSGTINIFANDDGDELIISTIAPVTTATVTENAGSGTINISNLTTTSDFAIGVTISDRYGQSSTSTINVQVTLPNVVANPDSYEVPFGEPLTANVITNDVGSNLKVTDFSMSTESTITITEDGALSFLPAEGFYGTINLNYTVTGPCDQSAETMINIVVLPPDCSFEATFNTTPATCILPDGGIITAVEPAGDYNFIWSDGSTTANLEMIPAGAYQVTVTSEDGHCEKTYNVEVSAETPSLTTNDEQYETSADSPVSGNVLENDEGRGITLEDVSNVTGGTVDFTEDGSFTFVPDAGFSGEASFSYQIIDDCGNTTTGSVTIQVMPGGCTFTVDIIDQPATCGLENGSLEVVVIGTSEYFIEWDNGVTGPLNNSIGAGEYGFTVTDLDDECLVELTVVLDGTDALVIETESIMPPSSPSASDGAVNVVISSPTNGPYMVSLNATDWGLITGEVFTIGDLGAGAYTIQLLDPNGCLSNVLEVEVPFEPNFRIGVSGTFMSFSAYDVELPGQEGKTVYTSMNYVNGQFRTGGINQELQVGLIKEMRSPNRDLLIPMTIRIEHLSEFFQLRGSNFSLTGQAGLLGNFNKLETAIQWKVQAKTRWQVWQSLSLDLRVGILGWEKLEQPVIQLGLDFNLKKTSRMIKILN